MVRKILVALAALFALGAVTVTTASAASVPLNLGAQQVILSESSAIGGSGAYVNGNNNPFNDNTQGFAAGNIFSAQTGQVPNENGYGNPSGFWLSGDNNAPTPSYITIDLGASYDNVSQLELFNTHNGGYNDRGTSQFEILGGNSVTNTGTVAAPNYELTPGTTTILVSDTLAPSSDTSSGIPGQTFNVGAAGSFRYLEFEAFTAVAADGHPASATAFGLDELRVFTTPEPNSYVGLLGLGGIGLLGFCFRRRIARAGRAAGAAAIVFAALLGSSASAGTITTITSGDAGGGVTLNPARIVYADDIFGQQGNTNVVQGVTFTAGNPNVVDVQSYGAQANGGGDPPSATFTNNDANSSALLNIVTSLIYGAQTVTIGGLTPNDPYTVQLLISDGSNDPRIQDISVNGSTPDVLGVAVNQAYDVSYNATANGSGNIIVTLVPDVNSGDPNPVLNGLIVQAVPEPSSVVALAGCGILGILALIVRRRKS